MSDPHIIQHVFDFNEQIIGIETTEINPLTKAQFDWTIQAYREEIQEFIDAFEAQDVVKMIDANFDLIYFSLGTLRKMGLTADQALRCFHAIHRANLTKKRGGKPTRGNFEQDAIKSEDFVGPEAAIMAIIMEDRL